MRTFGVAVVLSALAFVSNHARGDSFQHVSLGSPFQGAIAGPGQSSGFFFDGAESAKVTITVEGKGGLVPGVRLSDAASGDDLIEVLATGPTAEIAGLALPRTGAYRVTIFGTPAGASGSYVGELTGKLPKGLKKASLSASAGPGAALTFFALAGTRLDGVVNLKAPPLAPIGGWFVLLGPSGPVDVDFHVKFSKKTKRATLSGIVLADVGVYVLAPKAPQYQITASLKLKPPKQDQGDAVPLLPIALVDPPAAPVLDAVPEAIDATQVLVTGHAEGADRVAVHGPAGDQFVPVVAGAFQVNALLKADRVNTLWFTAQKLDGPKVIAASPAAVATVDVDGASPIVGIQFPTAGQAMVGATSDVSGEVIDTLHGLLGLSVTVNNVPAQVTVGGGRVASFVAQNIPLSGSLPLLTVKATDAFGRVTSKAISVAKVNGAGQPSIAVLSGTGQTGTAGDVLAQPIAVRLLHADATPFTGKLVQFDVVRGGGGVGASAGETAASRVTVLTDANGDAAAFFRLGPDAGAGQQRVRATSTGIGGAVFFGASANPRPASALELIAGDQQWTERGAALPLLLVVRATDGNNAVPGALVTFAVAGGGGTLNGEPFVQVAADAAGLARAPLVAGPAAGTQRVVATLDGTETEVVFTAIALARSPGASSRVAGAVVDGFGRPIGNAAVKLTVNGNQVLHATSDAQGLFELAADGVHGPAELEVDASSAALLAGQAVPDLSFGACRRRELLCALGASARLLQPVVLLQVDPAQGKTFTGAADVAFTDPRIDAFKLTIPQTSKATLFDGSTIPGGGAALWRCAQASLESVPALPEGREALLAWTLEPAGATFDPPLRVELPNVAGLRPGTPVKLFGMNPGGTAMVEVGAATVDPEGSLIVSDVGLGPSVSGVVCAATAPSLPARLRNCAGLELWRAANEIEAASAALDLGHVKHLFYGDAAAELQSVLDETVAAIQDASSDATVSPEEAAALGLAAGRLHNAATTASRLLPAPKDAGAALAALDAALPATIAEAALVGCLASGQASAQAADTGLDAALVADVELLDEMTAAKRAAGDALIDSVDALLAELGAAADTVALAALVADVDARHADFIASDASLDAMLAATAPHERLADVAADIAVARADLEESPQLAGAWLGFAGRVAAANGAGGFELANLPGGLGPHALRAAGAFGSALLHGKSALIDLAPGADELATAGVSLSNDLLALPVAVTLVPDQPVVTQKGIGQQLGLDGTLASNGATVQLGAAGAGTQWTVASPVLAGVDASGAIVGGDLVGSTWIDARNQGVRTVRKLDNAAPVSTTVQGYVQFSDGAPATPALVSSALGASVSTGADGAFTLHVNAPAGTNAVSLLASITVASLPYYAEATLSSLVHGGVTDAGILVLQPQSNVALNKPVTLTAGFVYGVALSTLTDGVFLAPSTAWTTNSVYWTFFGPYMEIDLKGTFLLQAAIAQGDHNDTYDVEYWDAASASWKLLWQVPNISNLGLGGIQTRPNVANNAEKFVFQKPVKSSRLRLSATSGDNSYSLSEVQVYGIVTGP